VNVTIFECISDLDCSLGENCIENSCLDITPPILILENYSWYDDIPVSLQLSATDENGISSWWLNDTSKFIIDNSGFITNSSELFAGNYSLNVSVNDSYGNIASGEILIEIGSLITNLLQLILDFSISPLLQDWSSF
jgi:hypothetical protein